MNTATCPICEIRDAEVQRWYIGGFLTDLCTQCSKTPSAFATREEAVAAMWAKSIEKSLVAKRAGGAGIKNLQRRRGRR